MSHNRTASHPPASLLFPRKCLGRGGTYDVDAGIDGNRGTEFVVITQETIPSHFDLGSWCERDPRLVPRSISCSSVKFRSPSFEGRCGSKRIHDVTSSQGFRRESLEDRVVRMLCMLLPRYAEA